MARPPTHDASRPRLPIALLVAFAVGLAAFPAAGGPGDRQDRREDRRDGRQDRREDRQEDRQDRRDGRQDRREDRQDGRQDRRDDRQDARKQRHDDWVAKREDRREGRRAELRTKWGDILDRPAASAELRIHGRRVARLDRIVFVAETEGKTEVAVKTKALLDRERARHEQRMQAIRAEGSK